MQKPCGSRGKAIAGLEESQPGWCQREDIRDETGAIGRNQTTRQDLTMVLRKFVFILKVIGSHR